MVENKTEGRAGGLLLAADEANCGLLRAAAAGMWDGPGADRVARRSLSGRRGLRPC